MITKDQVKIAKSDKDYMGKLMKENRNLIFKAIDRYLNKSIENDDIWQEAYYAFTKSIQEYDLNAELKPHNYIYNGVMNHVSTYSKTDLGVAKTSFDCTLAHSMRDNGMTVEEISKKLGRKISTVDRYLRTPIGTKSYENTVQKCDNNKSGDKNITKYDKEVYTHSSGLSAENSFIRLDNLGRLGKKVKESFDDMYGISDKDYSVLCYSAVNNIKIRDAYKVLVTKEVDKQGRPIGYPAYINRLNKVKKLVKESVAMGYEL